jgi:ABC-type uncharacterized transport system permease subunit
MTALLIGMSWLAAILLLCRFVWANSPRRDLDTLERMWALEERTPR